MLKDTDIIEKHDRDLLAFTPINKIKLESKTKIKVSVIVFCTTNSHTETHFCNLFVSKITLFSVLTRMEFLKRCFEIRTFD